MSEHPWTTGPWKASASEPQGQYIIHCRQSPWGLAYVVQAKAVEAEGFPVEANARLIAAAPALYDALQAMLPENCDLGDDPSGGCRPSFEKCERGRAALAKARGETP